MVTEERVVDYTPNDLMDEAYPLFKDILQMKIEVQQDTLDKIKEWIDRYEYACILSTRTTPTPEELDQLRKDLKAKCKA
jgi:hypothetical protein